MRGEEMHGVMHNEHSCGPAYIITVGALRRVITATYPSWNPIHHRTPPPVPFPSLSFPLLTRPPPSHITHIDVLRGEEDVLMVLMLVGEP